MQAAQAAVDLATAYGDAASAQAGEQAGAKGAWALQLVDNNTNYEAAQNVAGDINSAAYQDADQANRSATRTLDANFEIGQANLADAYEDYVSTARQAFLSRLYAEHVPDEYQADAVIAQAVNFQRAAAEADRVAAVAHGQTAASLRETLQQDDHELLLGQQAAQADLAGDQDSVAALFDNALETADDSWYAATSHATDLAQAQLISANADFEAAKIVAGAQYGVDISTAEMNYQVALAEAGLAWTLSVVAAEVNFRQGDSSSSALTQAYAAANATRANSVKQAVSAHDNHSCVGW